MGKAGRGGGTGVGDRWVKSGDWELGDHIIELCCFDSKLKMGEGLLKVGLVMKDALYH